MASIMSIEGIGSAYQDKLEAAGVKTVEGLLKAGATQKGRTDLARKTGINEALILKWVNHADLFRIKGVAGQYADLLEASGVDTVAELAHRNAANLHDAMIKTNDAKKLVRVIPETPQVAGWIEEAKTLPRTVQY